MLSANEFLRRTASAMKTKSFSPKENHCLLAAYAVYSKEFQKISNQYHDDRERLKLENASKDSKLMQEQARTVITLLTSRESLRSVSDFLVTPISEWRYRISEHKYRKTLNSPTENIQIIEDNLSDRERFEQMILKMRESGSVSDAEIIPPKDGQDQAAETQDDKMLKGAPWVVRVPVLLLERIFGGLTPVSFALLLALVVAGAGTYGAYARSVWKDNFDAEARRVAQLNTKVTEITEENIRLAPFEAQVDQLSNRISELDMSLNASLVEKEELRRALSASEARKTEITLEAERRLNETIQSMKTDATQALTQRALEQQQTVSDLRNQINALQQEVISLQNSKADVEASYNQAESRHTKQSKTIELQAETISDLRSQNSNHFEVRARIGSQNRFYTAVVQGIDRFFWARSGLLESHRACFRSYYLALLRTHRETTPDLLVPSDMASATYDIKRDPNNRLDVCSDY